MLENEAGGHRIQRVPPTEKRGRVHTSTVTVAVMDEYQSNTTIDEKDLKIDWFSGSGAGGQHRNKHQNCCRLTYLPLNVTIVAQSRSRESSYTTALNDLTKKVIGIRQGVDGHKISQLRKEQVGSGMRGDKIRTYRFQDDQVNDHKTGKHSTVKKIMKGGFDELW